MLDHARLLEVLAEFATTLVRDYEQQDVLEHLCADIVEVLAVDGAGVMLEDAHGTLRFTAASDEVTAAIEALQDRYGEGPCMQAYRTREPVVIDDLATVGTLPHFAPAAQAVGIAAVYSFPMTVAGQRIGALNLYRRQPGEFDEQASHAAQLLADVATSYLLSAQALDRVQRLAGQLQQALDSRVVIEQAKGKLAAVHDIPVGSAFQLLRGYARSHQCRLHDVASQVVSGGLELPVAAQRD